MNFLLIYTILGAIFLFPGLIARFGGFKRIYLVKGQSFIVPEALKFGFIPIGLYFFTDPIINIFVQGDVAQKISTFVRFPLLILAIILCIIQPKWLLPYWLRYLRNKYGYHQTEILLAHASNDKSNWEKRVRTHDGLVAWAEETLAIV